MQYYSTPTCSVFDNVYMPIQYGYKAYLATPELSPSNSTLFDAIDTDRAGFPIIYTGDIIARFGDAAGGGTNTPSFPARLPDTIPVAGLVGASVIAINAIWGSGENLGSSDYPDANIPIFNFIRELLRRSASIEAVLRVSLYYLHRCRRDIKAAQVRLQSARMPEASKLGEYSAGEGIAAAAYPSPPLTPASRSPVQSPDRSIEIVEASASPILCGRRMFLASLMCASKFLMDQNYTNQAWSKMSGLSIREITKNEQVFLQLMKWDLHIDMEGYHKWSQRLSSLSVDGLALEKASSKPLLSPGGHRVLTKHATEYPPTPPVQDFARATPQIRISHTFASGIKRASSIPNFGLYPGLGCHGVPEPISRTSRFSPAKKSNVETPALCDMPSYSHSREYFTSPICLGSIPDLLSISTQTTDPSLGCYLSPVSQTRERIVKRMKSARPSYRDGHASFGLTGPALDSRMYGIGIA